MRVLRVYHSGRDAAHRERDRALARAGVDVTLVVPTTWTDAGAEELLSSEAFEVVELPVHRVGDVNRHRYQDPGAIVRLVERLRPDVVDLHEEPFSAVVHQLLDRLPRERSVVTYTAQNIDKRFPPPFAGYEKRALARIQGIYPCTAQAASVIVGKGYRGAVHVLPLGVPAAFAPGLQTLPAETVELLWTGRFVPEKGADTAVRALAALRAHREARLTLAGAGPELERVRDLAAALGVAEHVEIRTWSSSEDVAALYARAHVLLAPSTATRTWVEQFGRIVTEAQAAGAVVVAYRSGSLPEVVGDAGVLVDEGDSAALERSLVELTSDPDRWRLLRERGLERSPSTTWGAIATGQLALYEEAAAGRTSRRRVTAQRAVARARFGEPAAIAGGGRPFALPILRENNAATRTLSRVVDRLANLESPAAPERLKVIYVDHVARLSGAEVALTRLIAALPNVDAHVVLAEEGPLRSALESAGARVTMLPLAERARDVRRGDVRGGSSAARAALTTAAYTVRLARLIRRERPDLVHTSSLKSGYYGSTAARLARVPVVWHLHDRVAEDYLPAPAVRLTRFALRHLPDVVLCASQAAAETTGLSAEPGAVRVIPYPYAPASEPSGSTDHPLTVGIVGRLTPWKGQDVFLHAFADALGGTPARARVIGSALFGSADEEFAAGLEQLAAELGIADQVTFLGFVDDVARELAGLDILVHASTVPEPFGQVIVEGMAAGVAVIASAAGGPLEIIHDRTDGVLVPPSDVASLASALSTLAADPVLRAHIGRAASERARDFRPEVVGPLIDSLYRDVIGG